MHQMTDLGNHNHTRGLFDDFALAAVKEFQQRKTYIPKARDDGRAPGTYVEQGIEVPSDTGADTFQFEFDRS